MVEVYEQSARSIWSMPQQRVASAHAIQAQPDRRPRFLRWLMPTACASAIPLNGMQQAELKLIAFH